MTNARLNRDSPDPLAQIFGRDHFFLLGLPSWQNVYVDLLEAILSPQKRSIPGKECNIKESRARNGYQFLMTPYEYLDPAIPEARPAWMFVM